MNKSLAPTLPTFFNELSQDNGINLIPTMSHGDVTSPNPAWIGKCNNPNYVEW